MCTMQPIFSSPKAAFSGPAWTFPTFPHTPNPCVLYLRHIVAGRCIPSPPHKSG
jgi:hypothetical protein